MAFPSYHGGSAAAQSFPDPTLKVQRDPTALSYLPQTNITELDEVLSTMSGPHVSLARRSSCETHDRENVTARSALEQARCGTFELTLVYYRLP